jgi:predicted Zn-dependent protease
MRAMSPGPRRWSCAPLLVPLLASLLSGCAAPAPSRARSPDAAEDALAPAVAAALAASLEPEGGGALPDGVLSRRVDLIARRVAEELDAEVSSVVVLASPEAVGRALPGGHLQISRGLLDAAARPGDAQPEVTALLAHLVAHAALDPAWASWVRLRSAERRRPPPTRIAPLVEGDPAALPPGGASDLGLLLRGLARAHRRDCAEADALAIRALARLGLAPETLPQAYRRLAKAEEQDPERLRPWVGAHGGARLRLEQASAAATRSREEVKGSLETALDLRPLRAAMAVAARVDAAALLLRRGHPQAARELLAQLGGQPAASAAGRVVAARALLRQGEAAEAERTLRVLLVQEPGHYAGRVALAALYAQQERAAAARKELRTLLRRFPLRADLHLDLGLVLEGDAARARLSLARALGGGGPVGRRAAAALGRLEPPPPRGPTTSGSLLGGD